MNTVENQHVCASCEKTIRYGVGSLDDVPKLMRRILTEGMWQKRKLPNGKEVECATFREFITGKYPNWNADPAKIEAIIKDDVETLAMWREAMKGKGNQYTCSHSIPTVAERSDRGRAYTVARLKAQEPELFKQVVAGDLTPNQAAIKAGWRKKPTALEGAKKAFNKLSPPEKLAFLKWATTQEGV